MNVRLLGGRASPSCEMDTEILLETPDAIADTSWPSAPGALGGFWQGVSRIVKTA